MHTVAVIPARGGSKGVPLKSIRMVAGKPLLAWVVEACRAASGVDRTIVSTDHEGIAEVAQEWGAEVPFMRPAEFAGDLVTLDPVIFHAVQTLEERDAREIDVVLTVQPTCPLLRPETIERSVATLVEGGFDSVIMLREIRHLYWRRVDGHFEPMYARRANRQELEPFYPEVGAVFASRRAIITPQDRLGSNIGHVIGSEEEALDIDTEIDLKLAELLIEQARREGRL
ncbi:MAG TPA: acylneuraminate cytidylyltransferase family protein [Armatimonadetes bacterium]|nr:acylneuraminate cytidylyltransferase family protein [Armatimonadota bacterium]